MAVMCAGYEQCDPIPDDARALIGDEKVGEEYL
jgi:hypothetical protein